jgi:bacterioferritin (cytochrome b1)
MDANLRWLLSFYRTSEIGGALFFGQLSKVLRPGPLQQDMTRHFADEAQHARYWTDCLAALGAEPLRLQQTYQDNYLAAAGTPVNLMEILAITLVFEKRVFAQYAHHYRSPALPEPVRETLAKIIADERWHIRWVGRALASMEAEYGRDTVADTLARFRRADEEVYRAAIREHGERLTALLIGVMKR